jgi:glycosyltransferase involved in cell wall biosynthesis
LSNSRESNIVISLRGGDTYLKPWVDKRWKDFYINKGNLIDAFITVSQNQKEYLQRWGIEANKIHVIPVSFGQHSNATPKYPNTHKLKLVSAFRMTWEKNIEGTIQFARMLKDKGIEFQYDIFGGGTDIGQLYYLVDKYDLSDNVAIKGKIDNDALKIKLVDYDFFVQLSISEALSVSILEAQSLGLPCVVSDAAGLPEAVIKGKTAIVYPYNNIEASVDECILIWKNRDIYYSYSKDAIEYVNTNFTLQHEKDKLEKLYKSLL